MFGWRDFIVIYVKLFFEVLYNRRNILLVDTLFLFVFSSYIIWICFLTKNHEIAHLVLPILEWTDSNYDAVPSQQMGEDRKLGHALVGAVKKFPEVDEARFWSLTEIKNAKSE